MALFPEKEPVFKNVGESEQDISPLTIERKEVVTPVPTQFTAQVNDAQGKPMITTPANQKVNIQLPKPAEVLQEDSKGDVGEALTWWARLWLRLFKKYVYTNK
jgi:hypothetical protein